MYFERSNISFLILFLIVGAVLGSALGTLIARAVPQFSLLTKSLTGPLGFSLEVVSFSLKINLSAIVGMILGFILFRRV